MLRFKHISLLLFFCYIVTAVGCIHLGGKQRIEPIQSATTEEAKQTTEKSEQATESKRKAKSSKIATLTIETTKKSYQQGEAIPLKLTLKTVEFDLLMKRYSAEMLVSQMTVKSADGTEIKRQKGVLEPAAKTLTKDGKKVECQLGIKLEKGAEKLYSIDNLLEYFPMTQPGVYTAQVNLELPLYKDFIVKKPRQIENLEVQIADYEKSARLSANKKQVAIAALQEEIKSLEAEGDFKSEMFVVLSSFRGDAEIQSNVTEITITFGVN